MGAAATEFENWQRDNRLGRFAVTDYNQPGLQPRYLVHKVNDSAGKHKACRYFVLDPQHDPIARAALARYAQVARAEGHAELADDLDDWVDSTSPRGVPTSDDTPSPATGCGSRNPEPPNQRCEKVVCNDGQHRDFPADPERAETRWTDPGAPSDSPASLQRAVVLTLHADRHASDVREFAQTVQVDVPDAPLPEVLRAAADSIDGALAEHARVTLTISEPYQ